MAEKVKKQEVVERLFFQRFSLTTGEISNPVVTLNEVAEAIRETNRENPTKRPLSDRNPANFIKDIIRHNKGANKNWPQSIQDRLYSARQITGGGMCFQFIPYRDDQSIPFPSNIVPPPSRLDTSHKIESVSLPLTSRLLGRGDEPWLIQVLVRLHVIETHLSVYSRRDIIQVDHLQMSLKLHKVEIDALFLAIERLESGELREVIVTCEGKGVRDDILEHQVLNQVIAAFNLPGVTQDLAIPVAVKALSPSKVWVVEFEAIARAKALDTIALQVVSDMVYDLVPGVPGIGEPRKKNLKRNAKDVRLS